MQSIFLILIGFLFNVACVTSPADAQSPFPAAEVFEMRAENVRFPFFTLPNMNARGAPYDSHHGEPMLVEAYFNRCPACNSNAANVHQVAAALHGRGVQVVDFGYDCQDASYTSWIRSHAPAHPVIKACDSPIFDELNITSFPTSFVVDKDGYVVKKYVGVWNARTRADVKETLESLRQ